MRNHEQTLYGLRYATTVWRIGEPDPFHEELGYWLWDAQAKQVLRCFLVPRGVSVIAGGTVEPSAKSFSLAADVSSHTYGICSNQFLDKAFKTVRYELTVTVLDGDRFRYEEEDTTPDFRPSRAVPSLGPEYTFARQVMSGADSTRSEPTAVDLSAAAIVLFKHPVKFHVHVFAEAHIMFAHSALVRHADLLQTRPDAGLFRKCGAEIRCRCRWLNP